MFDPGHDQAAGLRGEPPHAGAALMPVASPAQPARAYEWLCALAAHLTSLGREAVILDATAGEASMRQGQDGSHLGLLHALQDPSMAGLGRAPEGTEWLVMPGARGLRVLQQTARAGGSGVAITRLLSPFSRDALVLLFAPAQALGSLLAGLSARALVPVLPHAQASIDAYASLKLLHGAGLCPVLAPQTPSLEAESVPLRRVVDSVTDCAQRHLGLAVDSWPVHTWGVRVLESALASRHRHAAPQVMQRAGRATSLGLRHAALPQPLGS